jgi:hypothetical protein
MDTLFQSALRVKGREKNITLQNDIKEHWSFSTDIEGNQGVLVFFCVNYHFKMYRVQKVHD